jgi:predicted glycosyltransferase involved in capsule biosynthesis
VFSLANYQKKLAIVVPYRDRRSHLEEFIPHMLAYFERDKLDRLIRYTIHIVEQVSPDRFNRGKLTNVGFDLVRGQSDYVCFHDVDYLPIWADYSWSKSPARLIWHGLALKEDYDCFFGGAVLFDNKIFSMVNGYPNCYWGWGYEDSELRLRCHLNGWIIEKRDGTYRSLSHKHSGFERPGVYTREAHETSILFSMRKDRILELLHVDGINNARYHLVDKSVIKLNGRSLDNYFHYRVVLEP